MPGDLSRWAVRGAGRGAAREAVAPSPQETSNPLGRWSANKLDRWKTGAQTIAEDGDSPFRPINEQHPEISTMDRLKIMNVTGGRNPVAIHNLQKMGYEVQQRGHYDFSVRKPGKKWHRLDPEKGFFSLETLKDIADGLGGMFTLGTSLAAAAPVATATGLTAAPTGGASLAGGMAATSAAAGAGGAVGEGILTELGKAAGMEFPEGEQGKAILTEGAVNLLGEGVGQIGGRLASKAYRGLVPEGVRESVAKGAARLNPWGKEAVPPTAPPTTADIPRQPTPTGGVLEEGYIPGLEPPPKPLDIRPIQKPAPEAPTPARPRSVLPETEQTELELLEATMFGRPAKTTPSGGVRERRTIGLEEEYTRAKNYADNWAGAEKTAEKGSKEYKKGRQARVKLEQIEARYKEKRARYDELMDSAGSPPGTGRRRIPEGSPEAAPGPKTVKEVKEARAQDPVSTGKAGISKIEAEKAFPGFRSLRRSPRTEKRGKLGDVVKATFGWIRRTTNKEGREKGTQDWITGTFHQADPAYAGLEKPFYKSQKAFNEVLKEQGYAGKGSLAKLEKLIEDRGLGEFLEQGIKEASPSRKRSFYRELLFDAQPGKHKGKPFEHSEDFIHLWSEEPHRMNMGKYLKTGDPKHLGYRSIAWDDLTDIIDPETGVHYATGGGIPLRPTKGLQKPPDPKETLRALESLTGAPGGTSAQIPAPPGVPTPRPAPPPASAPTPGGTGLQTSGPGLQPRAPIPDYLTKKGFELSEHGPWTRAAKSSKRGFHPVLRAFGGGIAPRLGAFGALGGIGYSIGGTPGAVVGGGLALGGGKVLSKALMAAERMAGRGMKGLGQSIVNNERAIAWIVEAGMAPPKVRKLAQGALAMKSRGPTAWRAAAYTLSHDPDFKAFIAEQMDAQEQQTQ